MAHLIDRFRAALVLCPNASGAIGDTQGNPLFCLETPDVNELVAALVQSAKYPEVAKDAEDRLSSIWLHVAEKAKLTEERDALAAKLAEVDAAIRASLGDSRWLRQTYEPVRVVPIGSPTVRLDLLHALIAKAEAGGFTIQPSSIRAAIGEKGG